MFTDAQIEDAAAAAHEANRVYCRLIGAEAPLVWDEAPDWQRTFMTKRVASVIAGEDPRAAHTTWLRDSIAAGECIICGPVADTTSHPCFVEYDELPAAQKENDRIFVETVRAKLGINA